MATPSAWQEPRTEFVVKGNRRLTLTMVGHPFPIGTTVTGLSGRFDILWQFPTPLPERPAKMFGTLIAAGPTRDEATPIRFRVDGLPVGLTFTLAPTDDRDGFGIGEVVVTAPPGQRLEQDHIDRIPIATLIKQAMTTAGVLGTYFPAGYDGPYVDMWNNITADEMRTTVGTDETRTVHINGNRPLTEGEVIRLDLEGLSKRRRINELTPDQFEAIADVWRSAKEMGVSTEQAVVDTFGPMSVRTARRWIGQVRDAGLIPPLDDSDKRRRQT